MPNRAREQARPGRVRERERERKYDKLPRQTEINIYAESTTTSTTHVLQPQPVSLSGKKVTEKAAAPTTTTFEDY